MNIKVSLENYEVLNAANIGCRRQIGAIFSGREDTFGFEGDGWGIHIEGACGEAAFAKGLNLYWSGSVNTFKQGGDVGSLQVRTRSREDYDLIVRSKDRDDDIFVLVTGQVPTYTIRGWIRGIDAKQSKYLKGHGGRTPAYFVLQKDLSQDWDELKRLVQG